MTEHTMFPRTRRRQLGYNMAEAESFLARARVAYDSGHGETVEEMTGLDAEGIRHTAFSMQKGGYSTAHVDAALERLEDVFASRQRLRALAERGDDDWLGGARATAQVVMNRLARAEGARFQRVNGLTEGYHVGDVDAFAAKVRRYFHEAWPISVDDVRTVVFRAQRGGYREAQVDLVLDAVVDVMLAVR